MVETGTLNELINAVMNLNKKPQTQDTGASTQTPQKTSSTGEATSVKVATKDTAPRYSDTLNTGEVLAATPQGPTNISAV